MLYKKFRILRGAVIDKTDKILGRFFENSTIIYERYVDHSVFSGCSKNCIFNNNFRCMDIYFPINLESLYTLCQFHHGPYKYHVIQTILDN